MTFFFISCGCTTILEVKRRTMTTLLMFCMIVLFVLLIKPIDSFQIPIHTSNIHYNNQNNNKYKSEIILLQLGSNNLPTTSTDEDISGIECDINSNTVPSNNDNKIQQNSNNNSNNNKYEYPWDEVHDWILKDNISRYTIQIPITKNTIRKYILIRNLCQDIPELTGYPIDFLINKLNDNQYIIPYYITQFQFDNNGGITGLVYGIPGIEDGTRITTKSLQNVENTIPKRYVVTERLDDNNNIILYELGIPLETTMNDNDVYYSLDGRTKKALTSVSNNIINSNIPQQTKETILTILDTEKNNNNNKEILYIGGITAAVLTGAYVSQLLSHHLTVNVFWV